MIHVINVIGDKNKRCKCEFMPVLSTDVERDCLEHAFYLFLFFE